MADYSEDQIISAELGAMISDNGASFYNEVLNEASAHWGVEPIKLQGMLDKIAYHESAHSMDPTVTQLSGGPGRGLFQFEIGQGKGGATAARRMFNYVHSVNKKGGNMALPDWVTEAKEVQGGDITDYDASVLDKNAQYALMVANLRQDPKATAEVISNIETNEDLTEFWLNTHWKGHDANKDGVISNAEKQTIADKRRSFSDSSEHFDYNYPEGMK